MDRFKLHDISRDAGVAAAVFVIQVLRAALVLQVAIQVNIVLIVYRPECRFSVMRWRKLKVTVVVLCMSLKNSVN